MDIHAAFYPSTSRCAISAGVLSRVVAHVEENLGERLELATLAGIACMSRFHFARMFRRAMGESPMAYVSQRRIERAKRLLADRESALAAIAFELGFCDQSHFTRSFRKATGTTPAHFRLAQVAAQTH
jgi:AraC family transcriptional regulator